MTLSSVLTDFVFHVRLLDRNVMFIYYSKACVSRRLCCVRFFLMNPFILPSTRIYRTLSYLPFTCTYRPTLSYLPSNRTYRPTLSYLPSNRTYRPTLSYLPFTRTYRSTLSYLLSTRTYRLTLSYLPSNPFVPISLVPTV